MYSAVAEAKDWTNEETDREFISGSDLERNVSEILPVLPLVRRQLTESVTHVQESVETVCASFEAISEMTKKSVERSSKLIDENGTQGNGIRPLIESASSVIGRLLAQSEQSHERQVEMAGKIESIEQEVRNIQKIVDKIEAMSQSLKVLALNAMIEASRAGLAGQTFGVVAGETKKVAASAGEMNSTIQTIGNQLEKEVRSIAEGIRRNAEVGQREVDSARDAVSDTLKRLSGASDEMTVQLERSTQEAHEVSNSIRNAVISLQFQDTVSQRVGNVVRAIEDIESELSGLLPDYDPNTEIGDDWARRLKEKFTMASEHQVLGSGLAQESSTVELF